MRFTSLTVKSWGLKTLPFATLMDDEKWTLKNQIFDNLDEVAKLCKSPNDAYNPGGSQFKVMM